LRSNKSFILIRGWKDSHCVLESTVQCIRKNHGERRRQKINIQLQMSLGIEPVNHESAAAAVR
jgi:hypothetical protein